MRETRDLQPHNSAYFVDENKIYCNIKMRESNFYTERKKRLSTRWHKTRTPNKSLCAASISMIYHKQVQKFISFIEARIYS